MIFPISDVHSQGSSTHKRVEMSYNHTQKRGKANHTQTRGKRVESQVERQAVLKVPNDTLTILS